MPKFIIDTDELIKVLHKTEPSERADYIRNNLRDSHFGEIKELPCWLSLLADEKEQPAKKGASVGGYSPAFEKFWKEYPSRNGTKSGKTNANKAWKKVKGMTEPELLDACLKALEWQKQNEAWTKDRGQFIPMASTYLNGRRFEDEGPDDMEYETITDMNGKTVRRVKK